MARQRTGAADLRRNAFVKSASPALPESVWHMEECSNTRGGIFAGVGLALVAISPQTHEIGIRMALGAQRSVVMKVVFVRGFTIIVVGIVIGETLVFPILILN
jgi:hypothetical protein